MNRFAMPLTAAVLSMLALTCASSHSSTIAADAEKPHTDKIKFHNHEGKTVMSLKMKGDGAKLVDGNEKELARYTVSPDRLKIKDDADKTIGTIAVNKDHLKLMAGETESVLCHLKRQPDGDWKIENEKNERVAMIKKHGEGVEVEDQHQKRTFKVKLKSGKTLLEDADGKTAYSTKEEVPPSAMGCLGLESIHDARLRFALLYAMRDVLPK